MQRYNPKVIEPKWQAIWEETGTYTADLKSSKPKYIAMSMFNYPSGSGIHIGHAMNYTISDVKARFKRQQGYESYHPVGWDAFGLPAENFAIKSGVSPQESMAKIIPGYHKQYKAMGWSNDWEKEIATHLPEYYKWTQWIFAELYKHGLVYQDVRLQWWCDIDKTVLANEQVIDGKCWRHDGADDPLVQKREVKQWFFKITDYAEELLAAIDDLDWSESVKLAQKNWIGKSIGAEVDFKIDKHEENVKVFTTRADTIFGATFIVLAPEHELVAKITTDKQRPVVDKYVLAAEKKSDVERQSARTKTGVFSGAYAVNPINQEKIPIWLADYVLIGYGTGAIMAVPAHDERDFEFAKEHDLPITPVVAPRFIAKDSKSMSTSEATDRFNVVALAHNPKTDKFCLIEWPKGHQRAGFEWPGGEKKDSETAEEAALREFHEETGYGGAKVVSVIPAVTCFYHIDYTKQPRRSQQVLVRLEVTSDKPTGNIGHDDYEKNSYKVRWLSRSEIQQQKANMNPSWQQITELGLDNEAYEGEGELINSGAYNRLPSSEGREKIVADLAKKGLASEHVNFKMLDWSVSRQRYWGAPIPIVNCPKCGPVLVPESDLPVILPEIKEYQPTGDGRSALARAADWLSVNCPKCNGPAERETDTLDTYIDSSWYMYRYFDPHNEQQIFDSNIVKKWEPLDFYNGADHATAHLLYARFIARFFSKIGLVNNPEPFKQFLFNGKVMAADGSNFSKSKGNGIDPLEIIASGYGADALRTYLMFAAPLDLWTRWDPQGVPGAYRFLNRLWNLVQEYQSAKDGQLSGAHIRALERSSNSMIKKMTEDLEANRYNTAIAAAMTCLNELYKVKAESLVKSEAWQTALGSLVACIAPFAPHIADELWQQLGHSSSVHIDSWPIWDETLVSGDQALIVVQINGKVRAQIELPYGSSEDQVMEVAKAEDKIKKQLEGREIKKIILVPDKLVNLVVN